MISIIETGAATDDAAAVQRSLLVQAHGYPWLTHRAFLTGCFNGLMRAKPMPCIFRRVALVAFGPAIPIASGRVERVAAPQNSISLGQKGLRFITSSTRSHSSTLIRRSGGTEELASQVWQTIAADTSGDSGAEAVWVILGGALHLGDRQRICTFDLGNISPDDIIIGDTSFTIRPTLYPSEQPYQLVGKCLFPADADVSVSVSDAGRTQLSLRITELDPQVGGIFTDSVVQHMFNPERQELDNSSGLYDGLEDLTLVSDEALSENNLIAAETLQKLYRVSTSSKMGDPNRKERVESQFILVFMLCTDEVPEIECSMKPVTLFFASVIKLLLTGNILFNLTSSQYHRKMRRSLT